MIVIVEGIDRVGKTTLCKKLEQLGFMYFKDSWHIANYIKPEDRPMFSIGKLDTTISLLKQIDGLNVPIVVDRCHITEFVYGSIERTTRPDLLLEIDAILAEMDTMLVYVTPTCLSESSKQSNKDLEVHDTVFDEIVYNETLIKTKVATSYEYIDEAVELIMQSTFEYAFYFASPFFNPEQVEREEALIRQLRILGFRIFSPKESCFLPSESSDQDREKVFLDNVNAIRDSIAVFAVTDGKDMGTIWEAGFAYGLNKPILYFAETLGDAPFNLMLAQSGKHVFRSRNEITHKSVLKALFEVKSNFKGCIE